MAILPGIVPSSVAGYVVFFVLQPVGYGFVKYSGRCNLKLGLFKF